MNSLFYITGILIYFFNKVAVYNNQQLLIHHANFIVKYEDVKSDILNKINLLEEDRLLYDDETSYYILTEQIIYWRLQLNDLYKYKIELFSNNHD